MEKTNKLNLSNAMNLWTILLLIFVTSSTAYEVEKTLTNWEFGEMDSADNGTVGNNVTCTNHLCINDEAYIDRLADFLKPSGWDFVLISMHLSVFIAGIIGNSLVCIAVYRNYTMRNVTNYYIVNLAVADLMVIILCLPSTVLWDVTETWFLGNYLCKAIPYLQASMATIEDQLSQRPQLL